MIPLSDDNPTERRPCVTWALIGVNLAVFIWQLYAGLEYSVERYGLVPADVRANWAAAGHTFPSMFMHGGVMHLVLNMWFLHIFGDNLEDEMGSFRYLFFYVLCGVAADAAHFLSDPSSDLPAIGASGAISGVMGAYMMRHPTAPIRAWTGFWFAPIMEIPAFVFLGIWAVFQFLSSLASSAVESGVAYWAHLGGLLAGAILVFFFTSHQSRRWKQGEC